MSGSSAWARFNEEGEVIAEQVYWPELPTRVVDAALRLRQQIADAGTESAFRSRLPEGLRDGSAEVVIHHTGYPTREFDAFASVDVRFDGGDERSFGLDGSEAGFVRATASPEPDSRVVPQTGGAKVPHRPPLLEYPGGGL